MDVKQWVAQEIAEMRWRLGNQVLDVVPPARRLERPGGGNSIRWGMWHTARHADLALHGVLLGADPLVPDGPPGGFGLAEAEHSLIETIDDAAVESYFRDVFDSIEARWNADGDKLLTVEPDPEAALKASDVPADEYGWLYDMWRDKPADFFVRWEVVGHLTNHMGEMIATRNRMGLRPF